MRHTSLASMILTLGILACGDSESTGGSGGSGATGAGGSGAGPTAGGGGSGGAPTGGAPTGGSATGGGGDGAGGIGAQGPNFTCDAAVGEPPALTFTEVVTGLDRPVLVRSAPGRPETLFIVESWEGTILIHENGQVNPTPFLDVSDLIRTGGEEGLLGLAFHPDYATNGRFFIHYSASGNGASTIQEYKRSDADPNVADTTPVQLVLQIPTEEGNHNGGAVEFGNDGFLYITFGDGGGANDPDCDAQTLGDNLLGKIVRLDVNAAPDANGYPAAAGNPDGAKYYHIGLRNPWRISFDACTGDLYIGDVGQGQREEIDVATEADGALNFGWPLKEGTNNFNNSCVNQPSNLVDPITEYDHSGGKCSITGGTLYRGTDIAGLRGTYFYGDYCSGQVFSLRAVDGALVGMPQEIGQAGAISAFGNDGNGNVYIVDMGGTILRVDAN
jgi:glucose/arabinose dehydrogenase